MRNIHLPVRYGAVPVLRNGVKGTGASLDLQASASQQLIEQFDPGGAREVIVAGPFLAEGSVAPDFPVCLGAPWRAAWLGPSNASKTVSNRWRLSR